MKKFIILSIALLWHGTALLACGEYTTHNAYLFSVFSRDLMNPNLFKNRTDEFWKQYTNGAVSEYQWSKEEVYEIAKQKGDTEMTHYLDLLNQYLDICGELQETWSYPTKEELQQRKITLLNILKAGREYSGTRLKGQYALLRMRANMLLGNHMDNVTYWEQTGSKQDASVYRDMMENIYAGALLHLNQRTKACEIYAKQQDMVSIKWAMRKYRNLAGIKTIMSENPHSAVMNFLVQDFVNNAQETMDTEEEFLEDIDARPIKQNEINDFILYAQHVVDKKLTETPALWLAAIGELLWMQNKDAEAMSVLDKAVKANGTPRMKDNARAIRMVVSVRRSKMDKKYANWLAGELKWLIGKIEEEAGPRPTNPDYDYYGKLTYNHYYDVMERLMYNNLVPKYDQIGDKNNAAACLFMVEHYHEWLNVPIDEGGWNGGYSTDYFIYLDMKMSTDQLVAFKEWVSKSPANALEQFTKPYCVHTDYLNDLIGTRYIADADFSKAIDYLKQVPLDFLNQQNISWYMANRKYNVARWLKRQADDEKDEVTEGPGHGTFTSNPKLDFCREMLDMEQSIGTANTETRTRMAYELAVRYFQASHEGECWWLTQYGCSVYDTIRNDRVNLIQRTIDYLQQSKQSSDFTIRQNSYYALAYIPDDPWAEFGYDWQLNKDIIKPLRNSRQYKALAELDTFERNNRGRTAKYVSQCDVLDMFREAN